MIEHDCEHCGRHFNSRTELAGEEITCPACNKPIRIPASSQSNTTSTSQRQGTRCTVQVPTCSTRPHAILALIASLMLFGALAPLPYGYYQLLRFTVCSIGGYVAFKAYEWDKIWATWAFGIIAVLFNPLIPIHLPRELWQPIDLICSVVFAFGVFILRGPSISSPSRKQTSSIPCPQSPEENTMGLRKRHSSSKYI